MAKKYKTLASALLQKTESELIALLREAYNRIAVLEKQNQQLESQVRKLKTTNSKARQQMSSLRGQLKAEQAKVQSFKKSLKISRNKTKAAVKKAEAADQEVKAIKSAIKQIQPKLSKEQVFEIYRNSNLTRFGERMTEVHEFDPEKLAEMKAKMATGSSQKLRDIIRVAGWRSTWYDSDAEWNASELTGWDERNLYAFIMSY